MCLILTREDGSGFNTDAMNHGPKAQTAFMLLKIDINSQRSYEFVISNKNQYEKYNNDDLVLETVVMKKLPVPVMSNIHDLVSKPNGEKCAGS